MSILPQSSSRRPLTSNERAQLHLQPANPSSVKLNITSASIEARADPKKIEHLLALLAAGARSRSEP